MNTEQTQTTGARIRSARKASGLSQSALAEKIGSTKQTIYKYENDMITNIPLDKLKAIAASLSIPPDDLLGWKNKSEEETTLLSIYHELDAADRKRLLSMLKRSGSSAALSVIQPDNTYA